MSDDDWFERAFDDEPDSDSDDESGAASDHVERSESASEGGSAAETETTPESDSVAETDDAPPDDGTTDDAVQRDGTPAFKDGASSETDADTAETPTADASASRDDAERAFGFDAGDVTPEAETSDPDPFGGVRSRVDQSSTDRDEPNPFSEDFADAMGSAPAFGGESEGGQNPPDTSTESFDDEEFESDIDRLDIGIEGLDEMILGGVPKRSLMVTIGTAGTGKTTFGLQFLNHALENGEKAVYITLEESRDRIFDTAEEKGWPFRKYADEDRLAIIDLDPVEMANSLASIQNDLPRLVADFGAERLVLDSVSLLEMMYDHPSKRRSQVFDFARALKDAGVTTLLTSEAKENNPYSSRHGLVEYLADAVFVLQYVRPSDFRETRLAIEIQKIRDANHSRETKPYDLTSDGISVYRQANIF
ncbi:KaiC domain-containing protein [Halogeometricum borinquense]|uniref:KaiC domain-containing protein n=1 Tax=Halogeometricum borinquense TaxID=60847 RepID=A0A482TTB3_9EURY|nr:KaiC domain-containing protein [Halogeometricum borinquense]RYJ15209.1 KaiC domain-containing protein [Halogeometricum borinquense]